VPDAEASLPEEILKVQEQFLQARPSYARQLQLRFFGSRRCHAPLGDVLNTAAGRLHHLIVGSRSPVDESIAEYHGTVINDLGALEAAQLTVAPMCGDEIRNIFQFTFSIILEFKFNLRFSPLFPRRYAAAAYRGAYAS
jgi:hypothetical protein